MLIGKLLDIHIISKGTSTSTVQSPLFYVVYVFDCLLRPQCHKLNKYQQIDN